MSIVLIWFTVVIANAAIRFYLLPLYIDLKPNEKVSKGFLKWSENFKYRHSVIVIEDSEHPTNLLKRTFFNYRIDIQIKGLYRALFSPLNFEKELKALNTHIGDVNAVNPTKFFNSKKKRKIFI